jgi:hypothetical protein
LPIYNYSLLSVELSSSHLHAAFTNYSYTYIFTPNISTPNMDLSESQATFPSDSEIYDANYDANHSNSQDSEEQTSHSSSPLILYSPPTFLSIARGAAINLLLPFINGLMLGFGELFAHEAAFRLGWGGTRVRYIILCGGRVRVGPVGRKEHGGHDEQLANNATRSSLDTETQEVWDLVWRLKKTRSKGEDGAAGRWTRIPLLSRVPVAPAYAHGKCTGARRMDCIGRWQVTLDINS